MKDTYSTSEVAKAIKVGKSTLLRWLQTGQLAEPKRMAFGGVECRVWAVPDVERARQFREERYRKRS